jgi:cold shock CspA family protein
MKRQNGEIVSWLSDKYFGFIKTESGRNIFYSVHCVRADWKGSRVLPVATPVTFVIKQREDKGKLRDCAEDIAPLFPLSEPEDLRGYRESSEIIRMNRDWGFIRRPCGDDLFVHIKDCVPGFEKRWNLLEVGTPVFHGVREDLDSGRWRASDVELYSAEELRAFKEEAIPEPAPVEEPVPEVLAPQNKSKTFLQLALEKRVRQHELSSKDKDQS